MILHMARIRQSRPTHPLSGDREKKCVDLYMGGMMVVQIAKALGTSHRRVSKTLKHNGIVLRGQWTEMHVINVCILFDAGYMVSQICDMMHATPSTVARTLRDSGRDPAAARSARFRRAYTESERETAIAMYRNKMSMDEIARALGTGRKQARRLLLENGVSLRKSGWNTRGSRNPAWKGGRRVDADGYVNVHMPDHPHAKKNGTILEHRVVFEKKIGRYLKPSEVVHHKNGVKHDNRPDNLELFSSNADHLRHELTGRVPNWTKDGFRRILEGARKPRRHKSNRQSQAKNDAPE